MPALIVLYAMIALAGVLILFSLPAMKGWRTTLFNTAAGLVPLAMELLSYMGAVDWALYVPTTFVPWAVLFVAVVNILLRFFTTGPLGSKQ